MRIHHIIAAIIFSSSLFPSKLFSQETPQASAELRHTLRKLNSDSLLFPSDVLVSENFLIAVPDSIYNSSRIAVKKFKVANISKVNLLLEGRNKIFYSITYQVKGDGKAKDFLELIQNELVLDASALTSGDSISVNGSSIKFKYEHSGKYHYFYFKLIE